MDPTRLMTMTATVTPRVITKDGDDDVLTDGSPFTTSCFIWQGAHRLDSTENTGPENVTTDQYGAAFPADVTISASSKVAVDGMAEFEVDGNPWPAFNPRSRAVSHQEVSLKRVA